MELIRGEHNLQPRHRGCVVTIGNFDGVHLGHRAIIEQLTKLGEQTGLPTTLITFEPKPLEFLVGKSAPPRLTQFREKLLALRKTPLNRVLCLRFNQTLANLSAAAFIERLLVEGLGVRQLVVGDDFRFGHNAEGDLALLQTAGERHGFRVVNRATFCVNSRRASSSWVREALATGELDLATELLGRPYSMCGRVCYGDRRGRTIGFPTANIPLRRLVSPVSGVYAVRVIGIAAEPLAGVANVGSRPTVGGIGNRLEVHLLDFDADIYGRHVQVEFLHKIRDERRFDSLDALKEQIRRDAEQARRFFSQTVHRSLSHC